MEFADLDDDLFSKERQRNSIDEEYSARFCHHHWFLEVTPDLLVSEEDNLSVAKYSADYFFFKKDYGAAVEKYEGVLSILPVANTTVRRECYEGIARSYIKMGMPNKAVEFAEKMHKTSKTMEQTTVSSSVLIDTNIAAENYPEALSASQLLVSLHPFNSDVWLKLACVYAYLYDIKLTNVNELLFAPFTSKNVTVKRTKSEVDETATVQGAKANLQNASYSIESLEKKILAHNTNTCEEELSDHGINCKENELNYQTTFTEEEKGPQFVCACLFRSFLILKRTERTSFGFALDTNLRFQKKILSDMDTLLYEKSLFFVKNHVSMIDDAMYSSNSPLKECTPEFEDRGSSKFKDDETQAGVEIVSRNSFERKWFKWIK